MSVFVDQNDVLRFDSQGGGLTLVAGTGVAGFYGDNGPAINAQLKNFSGLALDTRVTYTRQFGIPIEFAESQTG